MTDPFGRTARLVVQAHDGNVFAQINGVQVKHSPREVSEIRRVLADAQAAALIQRGSRFE